LDVVQDVNHHLPAEVTLAGQIGGVEERKQIDVFSVEDPEGVVPAGRFVS
jgi:hypothetical protein